MANWALIQDGKIEELHDMLPNSWRHVSGLSMITDPTTLQKLGWVSVIRQYDEYDHMLYNVTGHTHELVDGQVVERLVLSENHVVVDAGQIRYQFLLMLRAERDRLLAESDWTQLRDVQNSMSADQRDGWDVYRQALRDLPSVCDDLQAYDIMTVAWPTKPGV